MPFVSVIMPVRNEAALIRQTLGAVLAQDYPRERLEVLVVDGLSTDDTVPIVQAVAANDPRVRLLHNPVRRQAYALNLALDAARGDVIARVDGHTVIAPDYVRRCVETLRASGADNVGGPQRAVGVTGWGRAIAAALGSPFGVPSRFRTASHGGTVDTVYLGAWPRDVFERVGRFDEACLVNEDYEHNIRIRQAGGRVYLALDIRSTYYGRQTVGGLGQQFFTYGRDKLAVLTRHPASLRPRQAVAPLFVAALIGGALWSPLDRRIARWWRSLLVAYGAASGIASVQTARGDRGIMLRLPVVFAVMHVAWGSGFWYEALRRGWYRLVSRP